MLLRRGYMIPQLRGGERMKIIPDTRWNDKCLDCVHTIQGNCPVEKAVKLYQAQCGLGVSLQSRIARSILALIAPYHGPCEMYWPRVRLVK